MTIYDEIKANPYVLYRDEDILLVLDHDPISIGHALILPQNRYLDIDDVPIQILLKIFRAAKVYVQLLKSKYLPKGYSMMQNGGAFNDIDVFHLHVFPRFKSDEFGFVKEEVMEQFDITEMTNLFKFEFNKNSGD